MNDGVIIAALISGIGGLFAFTTYIVKRLLDRQDKQIETLTTERTTCFTQRDAMKDEARELVKSYQQRDQAELERYRETRRKASAP